MYSVVEKLIMGMFLTIMSVAAITFLIMMGLPFFAINCVCALLMFYLFGEAWENHKRGKE